MKRWLSLIVVSLFLLGIPATSMAGAPTERVKTAVDKVITVLKDPALKPRPKENERRQKIKQAVFEVFDFKEMAKRSLGQYWQARSEKDRKEFVDLFTDLLERSYINRIEGYSDEKIVWENEKLDDGYAVVNSHV